MSRYVEREGDREVWREGALEERGRRKREREKGTGLAGPHIDRITATLRRRGKVKVQ
jgi:hypothetical protein